MKKKLFYLLFLVLTTVPVCAQDSLNMRLLYNWDDPNIYESQQWGAIWQQYNEIWGYADTVSGREYAIIGVAAGTYFLDVTDPVNTTVVDFQEGKDTAEIHRDFKTYGHYAYGVADEGNSSLQIFDLSYLPDSVHKVYDSDEYVIRSHNLFIDTAEGRLYICTPTIAFQSSSLRIMDIKTNPEQPVLLGDLNLVQGQGSHVHDLFVRDNTAYCSNGYDGLFIFNVSNPSNISLISSLTTYPEQDYNHSSWMSEDGNYLYFVDEKHGMGIKAYDITNLNDMKAVNLFRSNVGAMPHNVFVHGNKLYVSYYHDGVYVFDIGDPTDISVIGFYDTFVEPDGYDSYQGCWGVYPYLPSGTILASDFSNGLFVLEDNSVASSVGMKDEKKAIELEIYPNPVVDQMLINVPKNQHITSLEIHNMLGQEVYHEDFQVAWKVIRTDVSFLTSGRYSLTLHGEQDTRTHMFYKQ